jgi:hypothetical protein
MISRTEVDIEQMRDQVFFEGPERKRRLSRYWLLLLLSAVIASAGVVSDSTATVIGAMIIAPLMTPILGVVLGVVTADRANLGRCPYSAGCRCRRRGGAELAAGPSGPLPGGRRYEQPGSRSGHPQDRGSGSRVGHWVGGLGRAGPVRCLRHLALALLSTEPLGQRAHKRCLVLTGMADEGIVEHRQSLLAEPRSYRWTRCDEIPC